METAQVSDDDCVMCPAVACSCSEVHLSTTIAVFNVHNFCAFCYSITDCNGLCFTGQSDLLQFVLSWRWRSEWVCSVNAMRYFWFRLSSVVLSEHNSWEIITVFICHWSPDLFVCRPHCFLPDHDPRHEATTTIRGVSHLQNWPLPLYNDSYVCNSTRKLLLLGCFKCKRASGNRPLSFLVFSQEDLCLK